MIKRIDIENYRSCLSTTFEPNPHLSVLIGPNGSGKTNVLSAITLLRRIAGADHTYSRKDELFKRDCKLKFTFDIDGKLIRYSSKLGIDTDENNKDIIITSDEQWNFKAITGDGRPKNVRLIEGLNFLDERDVYFQDMSIRNYYYHTHYIKGKAPVHKSLSEPVRMILYNLFRFAHGMKYYSASQFTNPANCPTSFDIEKEGSRQRGIRMGDHSKFLYDLYTQFKDPKNTSYKRYFEIIGPEGIGLLNGIDFKEIPTSSIDYKVKSGGKVREIKREKILVIPQFTIGQNELSPNQLSEGTFKTITLLFYLITETSSLLLIEEPEVCVHHGLLSSIMEMIKTYSENKQIIVSTHSDFVLDHLEPENVFKVSNEPEKGTKVVSIRKSMSSREYNALRKYLDKVGNLGEYWKEGSLE